MNRGCASDFRVAWSSCSDSSSARLCYYTGRRTAVPRIPPTKLVDRSYSAYTDWSSVPRFPESHQRSWWIVHTQPIRTGAASPVFPESHQPSWWIVHTRAIRRQAGKMATPIRLSMNNPPTALVGFGDACGRLFCRLSMNNPPTALVGFEGRPRLWVR